MKTLTIYKFYFLLIKFNFPYFLQFFPIVSMGIFISCQISIAFTKCGKGKFTFPSRKKSPLSLIAVERGGYGIDKGANNEKEITRDVEISWDIRSHLRGPGRCAERERDSIDIKLDEHWSIL